MLVVSYSVKLYSGIKNNAIPVSSYMSDLVCTCQKLVTYARISIHKAKSGTRGENVTKYSKGKSIIMYSPCSYITIPHGSLFYIKATEKSSIYN